MELDGCVEGWGGKAQGMTDLGGLEDPLLDELEGGQHLLLGALALLCVCVSVCKAGRWMMMVYHLS